MMSRQVRDAATGPASVNPVPTEEQIKQMIRINAAVLENLRIFYHLLDLLVYIIQSSFTRQITPQPKKKTNFFAEIEKEGCYLWTLYCKINNDI